MSISGPASIEPPDSPGLTDFPSTYPTFQPPAGGDRVLRSSDEHNFQVHSSLLALASPVFRKMLDSEGTRDDVIQLKEDREALSILLQYIYPGTSAVLDTFARMKKGLTIATAYGMDSLTNELDQQLRHYMKTKPFTFEPLEVWNLCGALGLPETQNDAARLVTVFQHDFREPHVLSELAREHPEASALIQLVGAQGVRAKALADVLFAFHRPSMLLRRPVHQGYARPPVLDPVLLMCSACTGKHGSASYIVPAWMVWWAHTAYTFLLSNPLEAGGHLFEPAILWNHEGCRPCCISALMCESTYRSYFVAWASGVKAELASSLQEAESVYFT